MSVCIEGGEPIDHPNDMDRISTLLESLGMMIKPTSFEEKQKEMTKKQHPYKKKALNYKDVCNYLNQNIDTLKLPRDNENEIGYESWIPWQYQSFRYSGWVMIHQWDIKQDQILTGLIVIKDQLSEFLLGGIQVELFSSDQVMQPLSARVMMNSIVLIEKKEIGGNKFVLGNPDVVEIIGQSQVYVEIDFQVKDSNWMKQSSIVKLDYISFPFEGNWIKQVTFVGSPFPPMRSR